MIEMSKNMARIAQGSRYTQEKRKAMRVARLQAGVGSSSSTVDGAVSVCMVEIPGEDGLLQDGLIEGAARVTAGRVQDQAEICR